MTTPAPPLVAVPDLPVSAYPHGIFSAAALVDPADQREFYAGVEWEPLATPIPAAGTAQDACGPRAAKVLPAGISSAQATVLRVYAGVKCDIGSMRDDWSQRAQLAIERGEQATLEHAAWTGSYGNTPHLDDAATVVLGGGGVEALPIAEGVGLLEWWLAGGHQTGVIWASRMVSGYLTAERQLRPSGSRLVTEAGTPVVLAWTQGGPGTGPGGVAPAAGSAWLYATGPVEVRRSRVFLPPDLAAAHNRDTNDVFFIAERSYVVRFPPPVAAVRVALPFWIAPTLPA